MLTFSHTHTHTQRATCLDCVQFDRARRSVKWQTKLVDRINFQLPKRKCARKKRPSFHFTHTPSLTHTHTHVVSVSICVSPLAHSYSLYRSLVCVRDCVFAVVCLCETHPQKATGASHKRSPQWKLSGRWACNPLQGRRRRLNWPSWTHTQTHTLSLFRTHISQHTWRGDNNLM